MSFKQQLKTMLPESLVAARSKRRAERAYRRNLMLASDEYSDALASWFEKRTGEQLDLNNPKTFNQKVQWLKLFDSTPEKGRLADKYLVRDHIAATIGEEYLIPLLGVWDSPDEMTFEELPDRFVLKATHGSTWNIVVDGKSGIDVASMRAKLREWLQIDYALWAGFELHYRYCIPRIIAESYLDAGADGLVDYKVYCFNAGEPIILVCAGREGRGLVSKTYYDTDWNLIELSEGDSPRRETPRPAHLAEMLGLSAKLADGFAFVRVDWYEVSGRLYFGEMTFTPASGAKKFVPLRWNDEFGRRIDLSALSGGELCKS